MIISKITKKGQTTIPRKVREALNLHTNDRILYDIRGSDVVLQAIRGTILDHKSSVRPHQLPEDFSDVRKKVKERKRVNSVKR